MSSPIEDRVRDLMADRMAAVNPPVGWEERIVSAGRRRRNRRRTGVVAGTVVAVVVVFAVVTSGLPRALLGIEPVRRPGVGSGPVDPGDLPVGLPPAPGVPYTTGDGGRKTTIFYGREQRTTLSFLHQPLAVDDGFVALEAEDFGERLAYHRVDGRSWGTDHGVSVSGAAVSADRKRVAWMEVQGESETQRGELKLARLPRFEIIESMPVPVSAPPSHSAPTVVGFDGDRVALTYTGTQSPYAWDPEAERIEPLLGPSYAGRQGGLLDLDEASETVLLLDAEGCMHNLRPAEPRPVERWTVCGHEPEATAARISPDGRRLVAFELGGEQVWVHDLETGRLLWQQSFKMGLHFGDSVAEGTIVSGLRLSQVEWESPKDLLLMYGSSRDLDRGLGDLVRCASDRPVCERVRTPNGERVTGLGR